MDWTATMKCWKEKDWERRAIVSVERSQHPFENGERGCVSFQSIGSSFPPSSLKTALDLGKWGLTMADAFFDLSLRYRNHFDYL